MSLSLRHRGCQVLPMSVSPSLLTFIPYLVSTESNHLKFVHEVRDHKRKVQFYFGLYHISILDFTTSVSYGHIVFFFKDCLYILFEKQLIRCLKNTWSGIIIGKPSSISDFLCHFFSFWNYAPVYLAGSNRIGGVLVSVLTSSAVDCGFEP